MDKSYNRILLVFTEIQQKFGALRSQHGLASISAIFKNAGYQTRLAYFTDRASFARWEQEITDFGPGIIGFYSSAEQWTYIKNLVNRVPQGIFTIAGGPHPTCYPVCLENTPRLDAICIGEGEYPLLELAEALSNDRDYTKIQSLWVRWRGEIIKNPTRPFIDNLDSLPYEDRELFDTQQAINQYGMGQIRVMTTRGCPFNCTYCSNHRVAKAQAGRYVRFRSAQHILGELNLLKRKYQFEEVFFDDDIFMLNPDILEEFCQRYPREIGRPFVFCGRVECCDQETLSKLRQAGGRRIDFGVESGDENLRQSLLRRKMTNEQILGATRLAKSLGFQVKTLNMVGLPEETKEKFKETIKLNRLIEPEVASISIFTPYPGTDLYDYCVEKKYLTPEEGLPEDYMARRQSLLNMPFFPPAEIARCFRWFGFQVFIKKAPIRAIGNAVIYSNWGEFLLNLFKRFRKVLRRIMKGF